MKFKFPAFGLLALMIAFAVLTAPTRIASASTTLVVKPSNLQSWQVSLSNGGAGPVTAAVSFVNGPAAPPLGAGSLQLNVGSNGDGAAQLRRSSYAGTPLSSLTALGYSAYVQQDGSGGQAPYLMLSVDLDNNGSQDDLLFFEPVYQSSTFFPSNPQAPLALNTWQTWDAKNGGWWSLNNIAGAGPGTNVKSLAAYVAAAPNAKISNALSGIRIVAGFGAGAWDNFIGNADAMTVGVSGNDTTYDFEPETQCTAVCYVDAAAGDDSFGGDTPATAKKTIQAAVSQVSTGGTIHVAAGTYHEDVTVGKTMSILGAGYATTTVSGPVGGGVSTFQVGAANVLIDGFTVTRDGNTAAMWNDPLNTAGVAVQGLTNSAEIRNSKFVGNRTGIDINNSNGNFIHNNIIDDNRTGLLFRNQTDDTTVTENFITNNWTVGILFLNAGGSPPPPQQALNSHFNNNDISGNWYGQVVDRQVGPGAAPPGTTNLKDFRYNWWGTTNPSVTTADSGEPGYSAQIPVAYGGSAVAPGGKPEIAGPASANIVYQPVLCTGTDTNVETTPGRGTVGFQGDFSQNTFYKDNDGDGYGNPAITTQACTPPTGYVADNTDCNDNAASTHPNAPETCDGVDNDCDGLVDEGFTNTDGDSMADCVDPDDDNDGVLDGSDLCPGTPTGTTVNSAGCPLVTDKDQCKGDGWKTLRRANNSTFKNQGDCIQYANNGK